ncbi:MAG: hypothetical protein P1U90_10860 [Akkermansiaceae bacterium]|jgi:hypothetical protein|nr:hypothetical protein [Akkermansiaceae bacterium]
MKKNPHPDRSLEAANVREELSDSPEAQRALDALSREEGGDTDIPPIPDELREQWKDRYGVARQPVPQEKTSWLARFSKLWMYGGATALAALVIFISLRDDPAMPGGSGGGSSDPTILRGGGDFNPVADTITVYIASESVSFQSLYETRQARFTLEAASLENAVDLLKRESIKSAVILNGSTGTLTPWNGELLEDVQLLEVTPATDEYDLSEALDTFLKP